MDLGSQATPSGEGGQRLVVRLTHYPTTFVVAQGYKCGIIGSGRDRAGVRTGDGWDWVNLGAIAAIGLLLWRVIAQKFNDVEKKLDDLGERLGKSEDKLGEANTKLADLGGELRGRRTAEFEAQVADVLRIMGSKDLVE